MTDERKAALAIFLSITVVLFYSTIFSPPPPPAPVTTDKTQAAPTTEASVTNNTSITSSTTTITNPNQVAPITAQNTATTNDYFQAPSYTIETDLYRAKLGALGGRLLSFELKNYKATPNEQKPLNLINAKGQHLPLGVSTGALSDATVTYTLGNITTSGLQRGNTFYVRKTDKLSLALTGTYPDGRTINKSFTFDGSAYLFSLNVTFNSASVELPNFWLDWSEDLSAEYHDEKYNPRSFVYLDSENSITRELTAKSKDNYPETRAKWITIGDNYFSSYLISPTNGFQTRIQNTIGSDSSKYLNIKAQGNDTATEFKIYTGPKDPETFDKIGYDLHRSIDLGWFTFVGQPILIGLKTGYSIFGNFGLAIIAVTLIIKLLLLPLTKTSFKSMKAMQDVQPEMAALRERIKDPQVLNQEIFALYKRKGVNPMGGCLPMLLQIPVFLGMYNALRSSIYLRHADYALWINDLSTPEKLVIFGIPVPMMILFMGVTMFLQAYTTPTTADPQQRKIMLFMPVMFTLMFVIYPFPSGLVLYWLVNNLISILQQYSLRSASKISPTKATIVGSIVIFALGYVITLI